MTTETVNLELAPRQVLGKKVKQLRRIGTIPVHLYGATTESRPLQCEQRKLIRALSQAGATVPITVTVEGETKTQLAFAREIQWDPIRGNVLHVDFLAVEATQVVSAQVPVVLIGESPGARISGGTVMQSTHTLDVESLPLDMPSQLEVDLAELTEPDGVIRVADIKLPPTVTMLTNPDEMIARIELPRGEMEAPRVEDTTPEETSEEESSG